MQRWRIIILLTMLWKYDFLYPKELKELHHPFKDAMVFWGISFATSLICIFSNKKIFLMLFPLGALAGFIYMIILRLSMRRLFDEMGALKGLPLQMDSFLIIAFILVVLLSVTSYIIFLLHRYLSLDRLILYRLLMLWNGIWLFVFVTLSLWIFISPWHLMVIYVEDEAISKDLSIFAVISLILVVIFVVWGITGKKEKNQEHKT